MTKYHAIKTSVDGILFDSRLEAARYQELKYLQKVGEISDLKWQVPFRIVVVDCYICTYWADFTYIRDGLKIVEDVKGVRTPVFNLKWKLLGALQPDLTLEIYPPKKKRRTTSFRRPRLSKAMR
jgi:hypothetical protein